MQSLFLEQFSYSLLLLFFLAKKGLLSERSLQQTGISSCLFKPQGKNESITKVVNVTSSEAKRFQMNLFLVVVQKYFTRMEGSQSLDSTKACWVKNTKQEEKGQRLICRSFLNLYLHTDSHNCPQGKTKEHKHFYLLCLVL